MFSHSTSLVVLRFSALHFENEGAAEVNDLWCGDFTRRSENRSSKDEDHD